jgi:aldoxime dehydratase
MNSQIENRPDNGLPLPKSTPVDWKPPAPGWIVSIETPSNQLVIAYFGTQLRGGVNVANHRALAEFLSAESGPYKVDHGKFTDRKGHENLLSIAYWEGPTSYEKWLTVSGFAAWWSDPRRLREEAGYFREVLTIPTDRIETLFSSPDPVGAATGHRIAGPVLEHNYWGSMRDRIPIATTNHLVSRYGEHLPRLGASETANRFLRVSAPENLAIIRSGQDWSDCEPGELEIYNQSVRPALVKAMESLRDNPDKSGCCDMRFVREREPFEPVARSFGYGLFLSLGHMERWAAFDPEHLAIFKAFIRLVRATDYNFGLRLWHEVSVIPGAGQVFEYINCHPQTGLLPYFPTVEL